MDQQDRIQPSSSHRCVGLQFASYCLLLDYKRKASHGVLALTDPDLPLAVVERGLPAPVIVEQKSNK